MKIVLVGYLKTTTVAFFHFGIDLLSGNYNHESETHTCAHMVCRDEVFKLGNKMKLLSAMSQLELPVKEQLGKCIFQSQKMRYPTWSDLLYGELCLQLIYNSGKTIISKSQQALN